jgi:uncharacterized membrane protein
MEILGIILYSLVNNEQGFEMYTDSYGEVFNSKLKFEKSI